MTARKVEQLCRRKYYLTECKPFFLPFKITLSTVYLEMCNHVKTRLLKIGVAMNVSFYYRFVACFVLKILRKGGEKPPNKPTNPKNFYLIIFLLFSAIVVTTLGVWLHRHSWEEILHNIVTKIVTHSAKV